MLLKLIKQIRAYSPIQNSAYFRVQWLRKCVKTFRWHHALDLTSTIVLAIQWLSNYVCGYKWVQLRWYHLFRLHRHRSHPPRNYLSAKLSTNVVGWGKTRLEAESDGRTRRRGGIPSSTHPGGPEVLAGAAAWSRGQSSPPAAGGSAPPARSSSPLQSQRRRPEKPGKCVSAVGANNVTVAEPGPKFSPK